MTHQPLASIQLSGAYPNICTHDGKIYVSTGVAGSPWHLYELFWDGHDLTATPVAVGGVNPNGAPQFWRPSEAVYWEMRDGMWSRCVISLQTGNAIINIADDFGGSTMVARDNHILAGIPGSCWLDNQPLAPPLDSIGGCHLGDGGDVLVRAHSNQQAAIRNPDGGWTAKSTPDALNAAIGGHRAALGFARPYGFYGGDLTVAPWISEAVSYIAPVDGIDWLATSGFRGDPIWRAFLRPYGSDKALVIGTPHTESWIRFAQLGRVLLVVTFTFETGTTLEAYDLDAPRVVPMEPGTGPIDPPPHPPEEEPVTAAEVAAIVKASEERIMAKIYEVGAAVMSVDGKCDKLEELARAQRDGTVGSFFGTQPLTIKVNAKP